MPVAPKTSNFSVKAVMLLALLTLSQISFTNTAPAKAQRLAGSVHSLVVAIASSRLSSIETEFDSLIEIDASMGEAQAFYNNVKDVQLTPLVWSPDGEMLAIWRYDGKEAFSAEVCLLTKDGQLAKCLSYPVPFSAPDQFQYPVSWSPDSRRLYMVTGNLNKVSFRGCTKNSLNR